MGPRCPNPVRPRSDQGAAHRVSERASGVDGLAAQGGPMNRVASGEAWGSKREREKPAAPARVGRACGRSVPARMASPAGSDCRCKVSSGSMDADDSMPSSIDVGLGLCAGFQELIGPAAPIAGRYRGRPTTRPHPLRPCSPGGRTRRQGPVRVSTAWMRRRPKAPGAGDAQRASTPHQAQLRGGSAQDARTRIRQPKKRDQKRHHLDKATP